MHDPDGRLVEKAKKGDKAAFGVLADRYYEMVYAVAFGVLGNREDSLDTTQDVLIKTFHELPQFKGESKFKTWLYRITVNAAIDQVRKRRPAEPVDEGFVLASFEPGPRDRAILEEKRALVEHALSELSPEHRAVMILREWNDMSYEEMAEALQIEVGTVMSRLFYARKKLAEVLGSSLKEKKK